MQTRAEEKYSTTCQMTRMLTINTVETCSIFVLQPKKNYLLKASMNFSFVSASENLSIQHPGGREHQWDVACHVDHGCPVNGSAADVVIAHHNVCNNGILEPVHGVCCGTQYEYNQHEPAPAVLAALERWRSLLLKHRSTCQHSVLVQLLQQS